MKDSFFSTSGRIRRTTYFLRLFLVYAILFSLAFVIGIASGYLNIDEKTMTFFIIPLQILATITIWIQAAKRMHDVDKSAWYILIPFYNLILIFTEGTNGSNQYGEDPKKR